MFTTETFWGDLSLSRLIVDKVFVLHTCQIYLDLLCDLIDILRAIVQHPEK